MGKKREKFMSYGDKEVGGIKWRVKDAFSLVGLVSALASRNTGTCKKLGCASVMV